MQSLSGNTDDVSKKLDLTRGGIPMRTFNLAENTAGINEEHLVGTHTGCFGLSMNHNVHGSGTV